jgi:hypothetical protein
MILQVNSNYLKDYAKQYAGLVSDRFFNNRQFITGQEIIQLTSSIQVNFFIIKRLFELWQEELSKLKSSPYFDYRDIAVHEALTQFMNVLSRRIKVERNYFEPVLQTAVEQAVFLATDPASFFQNEIKKAPAGKINEYLRENKKYYKWHDRVITFSIDKAGFGSDPEIYHRAIFANYQAIKESLESVNMLLATLGEIKAFDIDHYLIKPSHFVKEESESIASGKKDESLFIKKQENDVHKDKQTQIPIQVGMFSNANYSSPVNPVNGASSPVKILSSVNLRTQFANEAYTGMKGILGELSESLSLNQRFMFTKELFDGNSDLLRHALKTIDNLDSFDEAVELVNSRFVKEMGWEIDSEPVIEFMHLIYRKFGK